MSHRGMEQVPTGKIDNSSPAAFAWAVMPPNPDLEAEMLTRLMVKFGTSEPRRRARRRAVRVAARRARVEKDTDGVHATRGRRDLRPRAGVASGLALDRSGFTVVDRDRSKRSVFRSLFGDPDADIEASATQGWMSKLMFWKQRRGARSPSSTGSPSSSRRRAAS